MERYYETSEMCISNLFADFDALIIPGGQSPANLREHSSVVDFVREFIQTTVFRFIIIGCGGILSAEDAMTKTVK